MVARTDGPNFRPYYRSRRVHAYFLTVMVLSLVTAAPRWGQTESCFVNTPFISFTQPEEHSPYVIAKVGVPDTFIFYVDTGTTIDWGDGTVGPNIGGVLPQGLHVYGASGTFPVTFHIRGFLGPNTAPTPCENEVTAEVVVNVNVTIDDADGDSVPDQFDDCPTVFDPDQADNNENGVGDACEGSIAVDITLTVIPCTPGELRLRWTDEAINESGWVIERRTASEPWGELRRLSSAEVARFPSSGDVSFTDTGIERNQTYVYRIRAIINDIDSDPSNEARATTLDLDLIDPADFEALQTGVTLRAFNLWSAGVSLTPKSGLAFSDIKVYGSQLAANRISLPRLDVELATASNIVTRHCSLQGDSSTACESGGRSRLIGFEADLGEVRGTFMLDRLTPESDSCVVVQQRFELHPEVDATLNPELACEGSQVIPVHEPEPPCAAFIPRITYELHNDLPTSPVGSKVTVFQRYDLQSGTGRNKATVFRDCDGIFVNGVPIPTDPTCFLSDNGDPIPFGDLVVVPLRGENPLKKEARVIAIDAGAKGQMDNIHQTFNNRVEPPGGRFPGGAFPGCPECTHLHWRWSSALGPQFNNGAPLIPDGSTQTVELQMRSRNKAVPLKELDELRKPVSDNPARNSTLTNPITWLIASSDRPADQFFDYPVFLFPEADLSLKLTRVGTELPTNATSRTTYTATIHNAGPASVTPDVELSAHVTVEQNSGALNVAATPDRGACIVAPQILGGFDMRCNLDSVSVTQESTVTIVVEAARPARIRIDGSVEGRRPDFTVPKNNVVRPLRTVIK